MKRRLIIAAVSLASLASAAPAVASTSNHPLVQEYERAYVHAEKSFGLRVVGCRLYKSCQGVVTKARLITSTEVLHRMFYSPSQPAVQSAVVSPDIESAPASGLASCIIAHESTGNPEAVNGQYEGEGQWSQSAWAEDGGTQYSSTPLGASQSEQTAVLNSEGEAGMEDQQGQYDGC